MKLKQIWANIPYMDGMGLVRKKHVPCLKFNMLHLKMAPIGIGDSRLGNHHVLIIFRFRVQLGEGCVLCIATFIFKSFTKTKFNHGCF